MGGNSSGQSSYNSGSSNPGVSYSGEGISFRSNYSSYNSTSKPYNGSLNTNKGIYTNSNNLDSILKYGPSSKYNSSNGLNFQQDIKYDPVQSKYNHFQNSQYQSDQRFFSQGYIRPNPTEKPDDLGDTKEYLPKVIKKEKDKFDYDNQKIKDLNECKNCIVCHNCGRKK